MTLIERLADLRFGLQIDGYRDALKTISEVEDALEAKDRKIAELRKHLTKTLLERLAEQESISARTEYSFIEQQLATAQSRIKQLEGALKKMLPMLDGLEWQIGYEALNAGRKDHD